MVLDSQQISAHILIGIMAMLAVGSGCMATAQHPRIGLSYRPQSPVEREPEAESVQVNVMTKDMREDKDFVCAQSGHRDANRMVEVIESSTPPAELMGSAIEAELSHRGFGLDSKGIPVVAKVVTFLCYRGGGPTVDATVEMDLFVYRAGRPPIGREFFHRYVKGQYVDQGRDFTAWNGENAKVALEAALADAMRQLFSTQRFIDALMNPAVQAPMRR